MSFLSGQKKWWLFFTIIALLFVPNAYAEATERDLSIIGKTLIFIEDGPLGETEVDIIYNPDDPDSVAEANVIASIIGEGRSFGDITLKGSKTEESTGAPIAFITQGTEETAFPLQEEGVIIVSANPDCAKAGNCILSVTTSPKVEIHVSNAAAEAAGTSFDSAFRMMITEHGE